MSTEDYDAYDAYAAHFAQQEQQPAAAPAAADPEALTSQRVKMEHAARLRASMVLHFNAVLAITKQGHDEGAVLLELIAADGLPVKVWLPKKLCSNLDFGSNTVCVWGKFLKTKLEELRSVGGLASEPAYYVAEDLGVDPNG